MDTDRAIVHDLAKRGPMTTVAHPASAGVVCRECGAVDASPVIGSSADNIRQPWYHRATCIWRRAVEAEEGRR